RVWRAAMACGRRGPRRSNIGCAGWTGNWRGRLPGGSCFFLRFSRLLALLGRLGAELLREPLDAALGIDHLLPAGKERMAVRADFEVQLRLGRSSLPARPAGAANLDVVVLGVDAFLHSVLLGRPGKPPL